MGTVSLNKIIVTPLKIIPTDGGDVMHALKVSDIGFNGFGEVYFSWVEKEVVKAWKRHLRMTLNLIVPIGSVRFVFLDNLGRWREEIVGQDSYSRLTVPPGLWFGFQGLATPQSLLMNVADIQHDPIEVERKEVNELPFSW